jgi:type VI secretion system secreted protein Hcp
MAFDAYLKIAGVDGAATRKGFEKQMEILSFSWGASNPVSVGTGGSGMGAGKVSLSSFNVMKKSDTASPKLFTTCCSGDHYPTAVVTLNKAAGKESIPFLTYEFEEVFVESIQWSGSGGGDDTPTESVAFAFGKVTMTYILQTGSGAKGDTIVASWNQQTNTK